MKKIAVLILSTMMLFVIAAGSLANSISLDYLANGKNKLEDAGKEFKCDAKNIILGGNFEIDNKFSVYGELTDCDLKGGDCESPYDDFSYKIKGDYEIFQNGQVRLNLSAGYLYRESSAQHFNNEYQYDTLFLGTDATFNLAENLTINAGFEYGLSPGGEYKSGRFRGDIDVDSLLNFQVGVNYFITEQVSLALGYRSSCWEKEDGNKDTISGITTGVSYKF